eukprot:TRINITY_DN66239_c0_g1_i1.p2 TRINITY_DN66239_c0_g1~~TRINITY_DN66239_c0_g1_i1.p2  ORF type:complete len:417 (+),score=127.49 TRINITY_DN66239_c0_g1_i1:62-1252(+)
MAACAQYQCDPELIPDFDWRSRLGAADWAAEYFEESELCGTCGQPPSAHRPGAAAGAAAAEEDQTVLSVVHVAEHEEDVGDDGTAARFRSRVVPVAVRAPSASLLAAGAAGLAAATATRGSPRPRPDFAPLRRALGLPLLRRCCAAAAGPCRRGPPGAAPRRAEVVVRYRAGTKYSDLGLQLWRGAYLLTEFICAWLPALLPLPDRGVVWEVGAGCGLVGLAAAGAGARVWLTDYNHSVLDNLAECAAASGLSATAEVKEYDLHWRRPPDAAPGLVREAVARGARGWAAADADCRVGLLLAADVTYRAEINEGFVGFLSEMLRDPRGPGMCVVSTDRRVGQVEVEGREHPLDHFLRRAPQEGLQVDEVNLEWVPHTLPYERTPDLGLLRVILAAPA